MRMINYINKIIENKWVFRALPYSILFNLYYLPIKQAIKIPILVYKPKFSSLKGKIILDSKVVKFGMIKMGVKTCGLYPNTGITWENLGGKVIFKGKCLIGNSSYVSFGKKCTVTFGENFKNTAALKLASSEKIEFGSNVRIGWDCLIIDTNFHPLYDLVKKTYQPTKGPIKIGNFNWLGAKCTVLHSTITPERCIFALGSIITKGSEIKSYSIMGGNPTHVLKTNVIRDYENDNIEF